MTYGGFLAACRKIAGRKNKTQYTKTEFAAMLGLEKPGHYIGAENDTRAPGRELLEKAARLAGFEFQDCIDIKAALPFSKDENLAISKFKQIIFNDEMKPFVMTFLRSLPELKRGLRSRKRRRPLDSDE